VELKVLSYSNCNKINKTIKELPYNALARMAQMESRSVDLTILNPVAIMWWVVNATPHLL